MSSSLFCGFGDHPHLGDLSLGFRRYPVSALHPQASEAAPEANELGNYRRSLGWCRFLIQALLYVPEFLAKTESALRPLPRSFLVKYLSDFVMG